MITSPLALRSEGVAISGDESENCVDGGTGVNDCGVRHPTVIADIASRDVSGIIFLPQFAAELRYNDMVYGLETRLILYLG